MVFELLAFGLAAAWKVPRVYRLRYARDRPGGDGRSLTRPRREVTSSPACRGPGLEGLAVFQARPRAGGHVLLLMVAVPVVLLTGRMCTPPVSPVMLSEPLTVLFW